MKYRTLGSTDLKVSTAGLGCGGASKLGMAKGGSVPEAVALVKHCLDMGVNFVDTAAAYGTEPVVGEALQTYRRSDIVIATKLPGRHNRPGHPVSDIVADVDRSLANLRTDYIDLVQLHGLLPADYDYAVGNVLPALQRLRDAGKIRHIGVTESTKRDLETQTLCRAVDGDGFDTGMLAISILNQHGAGRVLPRARQANKGIIAMMAVRRVLANEDLLMRAISQLVALGQLPETLSQKTELRRVLLDQTDCRSYTETAYRYVASLPGVSTVLFGTADKGHATHNVECILKPPLSPEAMHTIENLFGHLSGVGLDARPPRPWWRKLLRMPDKHV